MDRGTDPLLLPYTYTTSSSTVGLLLYHQYYQRCEPIILDIWVKIKLVLWQPRYYNLLIENKDKKIYVFEVLSFLENDNFLLLSISKKSLQTLSLDDIFSRNFTLLNSIISVEDLIGRDRFFEIFLIDHYAGDIINKNIACKH